MRGIAAVVCGFGGTFMHMNKVLEKNNFKNWGGKKYKTQLI